MDKPLKPGQTSITQEHKVSLDQWRALIAVIDAGGYAQAAEVLNKSQSSVSYAINQLETALNVKVFELQGRRAVTTPTGDVLYRRAKVLLTQASYLETSARSFSLHVEPLVRIAIDMIVPASAVLKCLTLFAKDFPDTRVEFYETVLSGTEEALLQRRVDIAIGARVPSGFLGDHLMNLPMHAVSQPSHPLQQLGRLVTYEDLRQHRQIVVRDSGVYRRGSEGWLEADQRITVSTISTSLNAVKMGMGYAWLADVYIEEELEEGNLSLLPLEVGKERSASVSIILADSDFSGPATKRLAAIFKERLPLLCRTHIAMSS
jgi:DNA-binding transcriptional LysR family regulator